MTTALTIKDLILFLLGMGGIVLVIFAIVAVKHLINTLKSASIVLKDVEVISAIAAERAKDLDGIIDNVSVSVSNVSKSFKEKKGIAQVISSAISLISTIRGFVAKKKKTTDTAEKKERRQQ